MYKRMRIFLLILVALCHYDKISEIKIYFIHVYVYILPRVYASCVNLVNMRYKSGTYPMGPK